MKTYVLVPLEPTREMLKAGESWSGLPRQTWQDMIDASPECVGLEAAAPDLLASLRAMLRLVKDALQDEYLDANTDAGGILCGDIMAGILHDAQIAIQKAGANQ